MSVRLQTGPGSVGMQQNPPDKSSRINTFHLICLLESLPVVVTTRLMEAKLTG